MQTNQYLSIHQSAHGWVSLEGQLTFTTIDKKVITTLDFNTDTKHLSLDLKRVTTTDSAGLALLMEWLKMAQKNHMQLHLQNIPEQLLALAKLSGLETMILQLIE